MTVTPCAAGLALLHVVDDHGDDRRPAEDEGTDHGRGAEGPDRQSERVQRIGHVGQRDQRWIGFDVTGVHPRHSSLPGSG